MAGPPAEAEAAAATVARASIEDFLRNTIDALRSDACRETMRNDSGRPGAKLMEFQQEAWDSLGIQTNVGQLAIGKIETNFPDDHAALVASRAEFAQAVDAAYLQCLSDRRPATLEKKAKLRRETVLEFLDCCKVMMDSPSVRERLKRRIEETGALPEDVVNDIHGEVMELLGFEREHGHKCISTFGASKEFQRDREVAVAVARWRGKTSSVCLMLLRQFQKEGGKLDIGDDVKAKLLDLQAKEGLDAMTFAQRSTLLEKNAKKVNVFRNLPGEARDRYMDKLSEEERLELTQSEILMVTLIQSRQQNQEADQQQLRAARKEKAAKWSE